MNFEDAMKQFKDKTYNKMLTVGKHTKQQIFMQVIEDTRVDTGRMKGNWQTTAETPSNRSLLRYESPGSMAKGFPATREMLRKITGASVTYLTNNVDYAPKWEEVDGMVAKSVVQFQRTVRELAKGQMN